MTIREMLVGSVVQIGERQYTLVRPSTVYNHTEARAAHTTIPMHISNDCQCEVVTSIAENSPVAAN